MKLNCSPIDGAGGGALGSALDTAPIQAAIDRCSAQGGGEVALTAGTYLCGTLFLKDNVTLRLCRGARLLGSGNIDDYPDNPASFVDAVGHKRGKSLLLAYRAKNIAVVGEGEICGQGGLFPPSHPSHNVRPFLVRLVECDNARFSDVSLTDAAAWCLHLTKSSRVLVENVTIRSRVNGNNDGIDIDASQKVTVRGCNIDSGDDGLCLKTTSDRPCEEIRIEGCRVSSNWAAFKIGTESVGDFKNITVRDCRFVNVNGGGIKIVPVDGGSVENVEIDGVSMENCTGPIFIATGERLRSYDGAGRTAYSRIKNVTIRNMKADVIDAPQNGRIDGKPWGNARGGVAISGTPYVRLENITLENMELRLPGGVEHCPKGEEIPELGSRYPEFHLFGTLPSHGLYVRHGKNIRLQNINISLKRPDARPQTWLEDVE